VVADEDEDEVEEEEEIEGEGTDKATKGDCVDTDGD
jgi:hypothetical protein